jgi:hypothetical protein
MTDETYEGDRDRRSSFSHERKGPDRRVYVEDVEVEVARHDERLDTQSALIKDVGHTLERHTEKEEEKFDLIFKELKEIKEALTKIDLKHAAENAFRMGAIYTISSLSGVLGFIASQVWQAYMK